MCSLAMCLSCLAMYYPNLLPICTGSLLLKLKKALYILIIRPLSDTVYCEYFLLFYILLFIFLTMSFKEQKVLVLMKSNLSTFSFIVCAYLKPT